MKTPMHTAALALGLIAATLEPPPKLFADQAPAPEVQRLVEQIQEETRRAVHEATAAAARVQEELAAAQARAVLLAQRSDDASPRSEPPEPPEPPDVPEAPEPPEWTGLSELAELPMKIEQEISTRFGGSNPPLVIVAEPVAETVRTEMQEDLTIMSRILSKAAQRTGGAEGPHVAMGIYIGDVFSSRQPQAMHLGGFGALFQLRVGMPLLPPPAKADEATPEKDPDSAWEKTRRELYSPPGRARVTRPTPGAPAQKYDAERFASLKRSLLESLKHAANIRHLATDQSVVVTVQGGSTSQARHVVSKRSGDQVEATVVARGEASSPSILTLRARKADIDRYAKGDLSFDEFSRTVQVAVY